MNTISLMQAFAAAVLVSAASQAPAQELTITPYAGWRSSGQGLQRSAASETPLKLSAGPAASISIDWRLDAARQLQLFASQHATELETQAATATLASQRLPIRLSTLHLGGTNFIDGRIGAGTYVVGGLGFSYFSPSLAPYESALRLSMNLGLGYQWPLSPALALRTELRAFVTLINSSGSFLCSGGCVVSIKGDTLTQAEVLFGLAVNF